MKLKGQNFDQHLRVGFLQKKSSEDWESLYAVQVFFLLWAEGLRKMWKDAATLEAFAFGDREFLMGKAFDKLHLRKHMYVVTYRFPSEGTAYSSISGSLLQKKIVFRA